MDIGNNDQTKQSVIYLFVSQNCQHCHDLIQLIQQKPDLSKLIKGIPVESSPKLPDGLTKVPGLYVNGKVIMGKDCFEWVNKYGEIEASPTFSSSGFEASGFSFLDSEPDAASGTGVYSFLGNGDSSEGLDKKKIDAMIKQEGSKSQKSGGINMDAIINERNKDMGNQQQRKVGM